MYSIDAEFIRFEDIAFGEILGTTGVYVLWTRTAAAKPSYIGEGDIVERVQSHRQQKEWGSNIQTGFVAVMRSDNPKQRKHDAEVVEAMLLDTAEDIGSFPTYNVHPGKFSRVFDRLGGSDRTVRVRVSGWHPLREASPIRGSVLLHARLFDGEEGSGWDLEHPWRASPGRSRT